MTDDPSLVDSATLLDSVERGGETGSLARAEIERRLSLTKAAADADMRGAWDWLAKNRRLEVRHYAPVYGDDDDQSVEWRATEVSGSINDREWTTVGRGATPLEAVLAARTVLQGDHP